MAKLRYWKGDVDVAGDTEMAPSLAGYFVTDVTEGSKEYEAIVGSTMHQVSIFPSGSSDVVLKLAIIPPGGTYTDVIYIKDDLGTDISIDTSTFQGAGRKYIFEASAAAVALVPQGAQAPGEQYTVHYSCW